MARVWHLVMGVACACVCGVAQADVVKLADLEARALSQRPEVAASAARVRGAAAEIDAVESTYYPQISGSVDATLAPGRKLIKLPGSDYLVSGSTALGGENSFQPHPRYGASVAARGTLYDFGRTRSALDAARAKERASQADASARAQMLVLELRAAYLRWSVAQEMWALAKRAEADAKVRADRVTGLIAEGAAPPSAATAASAQANAAAMESQRAELELESARLELGYLSALDLGPDALPDPSLLAADPQPSAAEANTSSRSVSGGSTSVGPIAVRPAAPGASAALASDPELAAKTQPAMGGGPPPGPAGSAQPSAAPAVTPPPTTPVTPSPAGASPTSAPAGGTAAGSVSPTPATAAPVASVQGAGGAGGAARPASDSLQPSAASPAADSNPQLAALETARAAAQAARRMQSRMSAPALGYRVSAGVEGQDAQVFPVYGFGVGLTVPLWDGGATSAAEAGARAAEAELSAQLDAERARDKHIKVRRNLQLEHANKLLALANQAVALAEKRVEQLQEGPTLGTADQEALAAAETDRTRVQAELIRAKAARVQLQLGL